MAGVVYALCAATALACAWLLLRSYTRTRTSLLLWSGLCFVGLTVNNVLVFVDLLVVPTIDFAIWRLLAGLAAMMVLLYGLIWNAR